MAWNNNSGGGGGPGGGGGGGPWGGGGSGGGGGNRGGGGPFGGRRPPDMEDVIRRGQERLRNLIPGGFGSFKGIQLIFGKPFGQPAEQGLHYNLPSPIGNVVVVNVQDLRRTVVGALSGSSGGFNRSRPAANENLMLTGDENIVVIEFAVLWQVKDVLRYAFAVRNGEENVRAVSEAVVREIIGQNSLLFAQTEGRTKIEQDSKDLMQQVLDEYGAGVRISQVQLLRVDPPQEVIGAFRDVQTARADKERNINED